MFDFDDIDLGIIGVVVIVVVTAIIAAVVSIPAEYYAFGGTGLAVIGSLVRGAKRKAKEETKETPKINVS